jgi:hypothetical protein
MAALTRCHFRPGTTGVHEDFGNRFAETFRLGIGPGFRCVNVQLAGWSLRFREDNRPIKQIEVRISTVRYDAETGEVSFRVRGAFRDSNADDSFTWEIRYGILALG